MQLFVRAAQDGNIFLQIAGFQYWRGGTCPWQVVAKTKTIESPKEGGRLGAPDKALRPIVTNQSSMNRSKG